MAKRGAIVSMFVLWLAAGVVYAQATGPDVHQDQMFVSVPIFVVSLISSIGFTWTIARYETDRNRRLKVVEEQNDRLERQGRRIQRQLARLLDERGLPTDTLDDDDVLERGARAE